jgi:hypothetical protein
MKLVMMDENGDYMELLSGREGDATTAKLLDIFAECIVLQRQKTQTYGDAWRSQGEMGNVARVLSKVARLKKMCWTSNQIDSHTESVEDTLLDLINLAGFTLINRRDRNKWGD